MLELSGFPQNRFAALDEIEKLLGFKTLELLHFFKVLCKAEDGFIRYRIGYLFIEFMLDRPLICLDMQSEDKCGSGKAQGEHEQNEIRISFELERNGVEKTVAYRFTVKELAAFTEQRSH